MLSGTREGRREKENTSQTKLRRRGMRGERSGIATKCHSFQKHFGIT
jgi:hypothetical protein